MRAPSACLYRNMGRVFLKEGSMSIHRFGLLVVVFAIVAMVGGCAINKPASLFATGAESRLGSDNYEVIAPSVTGTSRGFNLFGFIPLLSANATDAMDEAYSKIPDVKGGSVALVDKVEERSTTYLLLFSFPRVKVRATAIRFRSSMAHANTNTAPPSFVQQELTE